jgi:LacI family transcriptional regulator
MASNLSSEPKSSPVTIYDVAQRAGVSFGTVSRVLNDSTHVAPGTRQRVLEAIQELGYVVNRQAQTLAAGGQSSMIGVLVPDFTAGYNGQILNGIDTALSAKNRDMVLYTTHRVANRETSYITTMIRGSVAGLLMVLPINPAEEIESLVQQNFPFVLIDHQGMRHDYPSVGATNQKGSQDGTAFLIGLGHNRIGFITGIMSMGCSVERLEGYRATLQEHGIVYDPSLVIEGDFGQPSGFDCALALLDLPEPPTGIFCSNDLMAYGAIDAARSRGLRVPEDLSILGFDDLLASAQFRPPLTTIRQPLEEMGKAAVQMLLEMIESQNPLVSRLELPTELIIRDTCCPPGSR